MNILLTGATGFIGRALVDELTAAEHNITVLARDCQTRRLPDNAKQILFADLTKISNEENVFDTTMKDMDVVIHAAARVHVMKDKVEDPLSEFRKVNTQATLSLARHAAKAGVKRFIFLSTVKVNGESTTSRSPLTEDKSPNPTDSYAISKMEAEQGLMEIAKDTEMEVVIIRLPLIYGPGVKGNFASMMKWVRRGVPFPFGNVNNKRSLLALDNLTSFIIHCLDHPKAANEVFLLSDGQDVSTTELIRKLASAQGVKPRLLSIPVSWLIFIARVLGKRAVAERLLGSLEVNSHKARELLEWTPVVTMDEQLKKMVGN